MKWECNRSVQYLFTDFQKAYVSIHRERQWKCVEELKIPIKVISMCKTCTEGKKCCKNRVDIVIFLKRS
jgi:hypothetical protein